LRICGVGEGGVIHEEGGSLLRRERRRRAPENLGSSEPGSVGRGFGNVNGGRGARGEDCDAMRGGVGRGAATASISTISSVLFRATPSYFIIDGLVRRTV
jgi:hypothetical protein